MTPSEDHNEYRNWSPQRAAEVAFLSLPTGYNGRAIANAHNRTPLSRVAYESLASALIGAFSWDESPEGGDFWEQVYSFYAHPNPKRQLPPLPVTVE
jgi:hypothetical protein